MPGDETIKYFDDSYSRLVKLRDGKPVEFGAQGAPYDKSQEPELAEQIFTLTGYRVRFGEWEDLFPYNPRDRECRVPLEIIG